MAHTVFVDGVTTTANRIVAAWLNDADTVTYVRFGDGTNYTGNLTVPGTTALTGTLTATTINASGLVAMAAAATVGTTLGVTGVATLSSTTDASSATTGGTIISGGLGVAKKLYVGSKFTITTSGVANDFVTMVNTAGTAKTWLMGPGTPADGFFGLYNSTNGVTAWTVSDAGAVTIPGTLSVTGTSTMAAINASGSVTLSGTSFFRSPTTSNTPGTFNFYLAASGIREGTAGDVNIDTYSGGWGSRLAISQAGAVTIPGTLGVTGATTLSGKLTTSFAGGGNFVALFRNTTAATPYTVRIEEPAAAVSGYPMLQVVDSTGATDRFRVNSGTGGTTVGGTLGVTGTLSGGTSGTAYSFSGSAAAGSLTLDSGGRLGIGQTNPISFIDVYGNGAYTYARFYRSDEGGYGGRVGTGNSLYGPGAARSLGLDGFSEVSIGIAGTRYVQLTSSALTVTPNASFSGTLDVTNVATFNNQTNVSRNATQGQIQLAVNWAYGVIIYEGGAVGANGAATVLVAQKNSSTGRSINAAGTINASGADYAEYERKSSLSTLFAKGDIVGFDKDGLLTNSKAVTYGVKSTNPSYVGGDVWGDEESIGKRPNEPKELLSDASESEKEKYEKDVAEFPALLDAFEAKLDAARQWVDRVAYCGKTPVNVTGATPGEFIVADNGGEVWDLTADATVPDWFKKYLRTVGRVRRILPDGRAEIAVYVH